MFIFYIYIYICIYIYVFIYISICCGLHSLTSLINLCIVIFILHSIVAVHPRRSILASPGHNPRNKSLSLMIIFTFPTLFFSPPGHPYGPVWAIWAHMDPYIILFVFHMIYICLLHCFI